MTGDREQPASPAALWRAGFDYHRQLLGIELDARLSAIAVAPSRVAGMVDVASVTVWRGLRRRAGLGAWPVAVLRASGVESEEARDPASFVFACEDGGELAPGVPSLVMPEFCSPRQTRVRFVRDSSGRGRYMLEPGGPGEGVDITLGWAHVAVAPLASDGPDPRGAYGLGIGVPVRRFVFDLLVHGAMTHVRHIHPTVMAHVPGLPDGEEADGDAVALPVQADVVDMGPATDARADFEPRYAEILGRALARIDRRPAEFRLFRYELAFPPFGAQVLLWHTLLPACRGPGPRPDGLA